MQKLLMKLEVLLVMMIGKEQGNVNNENKKYIKNIQVQDVGWW